VGSILPVCGAPAVLVPPYDDVDGPQEGNRYASFIELGLDAHVHEPKLGVDGFLERGKEETRIAKAVRSLKASCRSTFKSTGRNRICPSWTSRSDRPRPEGPRARGRRRCL
jgi:hypothetical protein